MERLPHARHSLEFKQEAVRMAVDSGLGVAETARRLSVSSKTLSNWVKLSKQKGRELTGVSENEAELSRLRKENARLRMECEILKKAAVYFAKESL